VSDLAHVFHSRVLLCSVFLLISPFEASGTIRVFWTTKPSQITCILDPLLMPQGTFTDNCSYTSVNSCCLSFEALNARLRWPAFCENWFLIQPTVLLSWLTSRVKNWFPFSAAVGKCCPSAGTLEFLLASSISPEYQVSCVKFDWLIDWLIDRLTDRSINY
jgi:hypothetical protein